MSLSASQRGVLAILARAPETAAVIHQAGGNTRSINSLMRRDLVTADHHFPGGEVYMLTARARRLLGIDNA